MRLLKRNLTKFEYLPYTGVETDLNDENEHTGDFKPVCGDPVSYKGNISIPSGQTNLTFYGLEGRYTHTLVMDDPDADIREGGVVRWKDHSYDVIAVRPSINVLSVALRRQTEDYGEGPAGEPGSDEP